MNEHPVIPPVASAFLHPRRHGLLIGGEWRAPVAGEWFETRDPASGEVLAEVASGTAADIDAAVMAARAAFNTGPWHGMTGMQRGRILWRIADLIEQHLEELAVLETLDNGKPVAASRRGDIPAAAGQFRYYAGLAPRIEGTYIPTNIAYQPAGRRMFAHARREPIGVVGAICPWNSPLVMAAMKLAPALAAGCCVVLKPAEETPLTALRLGEIMMEAGLPPGVVNIVTGDGPDAGAALASHPGVDKISFTGSTEVGRRIIAAAMPDMKKLTLELGGKSPMLVMADADMGLAVPGVARGIFSNAGQVCVAGSRIYVHRSRYDELVEGLCQQAKSMRMGHGLEGTTEIGPLINTTQAERVAEFISGGRTEGAQVLAGGQRRDAAFFEPTVIAGARPEMRIMREEIFGPVAMITPFDTWEEAITAANDTRYGLAASVWTQDISVSERTVSAIRAGTVWVNCHSYFSPDLPKGGRGLSGWGVENGTQGLDNYMEWKTVCAVT